MFESVAEVINRCSVLLQKWRAAHQESGQTARLQRPV